MSRTAISRDYLRRCAKVAVRYAIDANDFYGMRNVMFDILNSDGVSSRLWGKKYNIKRINKACWIGLKSIKQ